MGRLNGINWKRVRGKRALTLLLAILPILSTSGCTRQVLDTFRPEINISNGMIDSTNVWDTGYELTTNDEATGDDSSRDSGTEVTGPGTGEGETNMEISSYSPIPYDVVSSSDYTVYLREKVYQPIEAVLKELQSSNSSLMSNLYFRVYHIGYNRARDDSDMDLVRSAAYNMKYPSSPSLSTVGGSVIPTFMYSYMMKRYDNQVLRDRQVERFAASLEGYDGSMTYEQARLDENFPSNIVSMWLYEPVKNSCATLDDFRRYVGANPNKSVPNLKLSVLTGATSSQQVIFNDIRTLTRRAPYQGGIARTEFDKMLTTVSQFTSSTYDIDLSINSFDDQSICWAYIDKYSVTMVAVACPPGMDLKDMLGDKWYEIQGIIVSTAKWSDVANIQSAMGDDREVAVIEKGLRGR